MDSRKKKNKQKNDMVTLPALAEWPGIIPVKTDSNFTSDIYNTKRPYLT